jgi:hypothetical protein
MIEKDGTQDTAQLETVLLDGEKVEQEKVSDPGEHEGKPKVDKAEPAPGSPRWNEVYGKWKAAERELETLRGQVGEKDKLVKDKEKEVEFIRKQAEQTVELARKSVEKKDDDKPDPLDKELSDLDENIQSIRDDLKAARDNFDDAKVSKLEDKLDNLKDKRADLRAEKRLKEAQKKAAPPDKTEKKDDTPPDVKTAIDDFRKDASWFDPKSKDFDEVMQVAAIAIDARLNDEKEWKDRPYAERLAEVKKRTETRFGYKSKDKKDDDEDEPKDKKKSSMVESGKQKGDDSHKAKELTEEQKITARKFWSDVPPAEAYANYRAGMEA